MGSEKLEALRARLTDYETRGHIRHAPLHAEEQTAATPITGQLSTQTVSAAQGGKVTSM